jgi:hypothetical protein
MNRRRLSNRLYSIPSWILIVLTLVSPALAADIQLQAYSASYDLHKGGMHVATSELSLQRQDELWRWRTSVKPRGIYSVLTSSNPFSETTFTQTDSDIHLQQVVVSDPANPDKFESADFDWNRGSIDVLRKGKQKQLVLNTTVFDYNSLHLLAAMMREHHLDTTNFIFYRKGKLRKSRIVYLGETEVDINGEQVRAHTFEQTTTKSKSRVKYHYDAAHPLLPLRIERFKSDESPAVLTLRKVEWNL